MTGGSSPLAAEALIVFSPSSGALLYANGAAGNVFDARDDELLALDADEILAEFADVTPRTFNAVARTRRGSERGVEVRLEALRSGAFVRTGAMLAVIRPLDGTNHEAPPSVTIPSADHAYRASRLESLWTLTVGSPAESVDQLRAIMREGLRALDCQSALLCRVMGGQLVIEVAEPDRGAHPEPDQPVDQTMESLALESAQTVSVTDTNADERLREYPEVTEGNRSFLARAFTVGDTRWVLSLYTAHPRSKPHDDEDVRYVGRLTEALAALLSRRDSDARFRHLAFSDALTGLPNRAGLFSRLDETLAAADRYGRQVALLFLDVDGFKAVNDTVGHRSGDAVLSEMGHRLRSTLRREEYVGRFGGDEFAIILPQVTSREEIDQVAQRVGGVLAPPFIINGYRFALSASIGVAVYPTDATTREDLLTRADAAMYSAKQAGRSQVRFHDSSALAAPAPRPEPDVVPSTVRTIVGSEPAGLGYLLCYQPMADLRGGGIVGAEALIRRVHPQHGLLAPERILTSVKDEAARRALDSWVIAEAARQAKDWNDAGNPLRVAVNLAAFDPREFTALLAENPEIDLSSVVIEVSRGQLVGDASVVSEFLDACRRTGLSLSLENFDGGLRDLETFERYPIESLKLDRSLVEGVTRSRAAQAIIEGTVLIARAMGWRVVAKGVETIGQRDALSVFGCDVMQGYYVAHPMTAFDFGLWYGARQTVASTT